MGYSIAIETPLQDDVRRLVEDLNAHLLPLSPLEFQFKMTVEQMADSDTTLFVVRNAGGTAVGMGALKMHEDGLGEVKRMFVDPAERGTRLGRMILEAVMALARDRGLAELKLETGEGPGFEGAQRLYERCGFTRCGAFLDYPDSEWSAFYRLPLVAVPA